MRRVVWAEYISVDGVVDDPTWTAPFWNDEIENIQKHQLFRSDALLLGRVTYEGFASAWPNITDPNGFADRMNRLPKYVASRTLQNLSWNASVIQGNVFDAVATMKRETGGDLLIYGSATFAQSLVERDLVDEFRLMVHPVVVGRGKHLISNPSSSKTLRLIETQTTRSGIAVLVYEPARETADLSHER